MKLVNLTPHPIHVYAQGQDEIILTLPSEGVARCTQHDEQIGWVQHEVDDSQYAECVVVPLYRTTYGDVTGLPDPQPGVYYIVSALVAQAVRGRRTDVLVPSQPVRNSLGQIVGCRGFAQI